MVPKIERSGNRKSNFLGRGKLDVSTESIKVNSQKRLSGTESKREDGELLEQIPDETENVGSIELDDNTLTLTLTGNDDNSKQFFIIEKPEKKETIIETIPEKIETIIETKPEIKKGSFDDPLSEIDSKIKELSMLLGEK